MVCFDCLSTGVGAAAAGVGLAGCSVTGCFASVAGAEDGFSSGTDNLSEVAGVAGATVGVVVCGTAVGVGGSNSSGSSGVW